MFKKISRTLLYLIVFLVPLFTLPLTANVLDFAKQFLFLLLILLALFFWVWGMVVAKKIDIKYNRTLALVGVFLGVILIASIFSQYAYGSFWGLPLSIGDSFVTLLGFSLMYFLAVNLFEKRETKDLVFVLAVSGGLTALYAFFQSFGLYLVPFGYAKDASFNTVGTSGGLVFVLAVLFSAVLPLLFSNKGWRKWVLVACVALYGIDLILFNVTLAWVALTVGLLASFLFLMSSDEFAKVYRSARAVVFAFLAVAIVFSCIDFFASDVFSSAYSTIYKQIGFIGQPAEVYLSQSATARLTIDTVRQSAKSFFLGSGPGTFIYDFEKYKPAVLAQNDNFWNVEFVTGASQMLDTFAAAGFLGLLALLLLAAYVTLNGFKMLTEEKTDGDLMLAIFSGWLASLAMAFLYPFTFTGVLVFWFFLALLGISGASKTLSYELNSIKAAYFVSLSMIVLLVVEVGFIVWVSKRYYAEAKYREALVDVQKNNIDGALSSLGQASMAVQDMQDNYLTALAQAYLAKANQISSQANQQNPSSKDSAAVTNDLTLAVKYAQQAADKVNPNNIANWSVKGYVFAQLAAAKVPNMADTAQQSYQKAIDLESSNPSLWLQAGQVMLIKNDLAGAKTDFQKAVDLNPNYSDARYYLGLIDDQQGDKQGAVAQFTTIAQLNPDNQTITQILQNLQAGKPALGEQAQQVPAPSTALPSVPTSLQEQQALPGALPTPAAPDNGATNTTPQSQGSDSGAAAQSQSQTNQPSVPATKGGAAQNVIPQTLTPAK